MNIRTIRILLVSLLVSPIGLCMKSGTYNLRYDTPADVIAGNGWAQRAPIIASLIRFHDFEVLGTQEGLPNQMLDLERLLPEYAIISHGRNDGKLAGEHVGILYLRDRFDVVEKGFFWLSETPERPGKGWDAKFPRICTWAKLRRKGGTESFSFFSTHLDHHGAASRQESIGLILKKIDGISNGGPVILVGDFNADQNSSAYQLLASSGSLVDAAKTSKVSYLLNGTTNGFNPNGESANRIDHVFVSAGTQVRRLGILTDSYRIPKKRSRANGHSDDADTAGKFKDHEARLPSDHFPVFVEIAFP